MTRDYRTLDAIVVVACLVMLGAAGWALVFIKIPQENLPIFASLVSSTAGAGLGVYIGWRWASGAKKPDVPGTTITTPPGPSTLTVETPPTTSEPKP